MYSIENDAFQVTLGASGQLTSVEFRKFGDDLIQEPRLAGSFRVSLPLPGRLDHLIQGEDQNVTVHARSTDELVMTVEKLTSELGEFDIQAEFVIRLTNERIEFTSTFRNNTPYPLAEIWYPILGGVVGLDRHSSMSWWSPGYTGGDSGQFAKASGYMLGQPFPSRVWTYPEYGTADFDTVQPMCMPWITIRDDATNHGMYLAEHNTIQRHIDFTTAFVPGFHASDGDDDWPTFEELDGEPAGIVFAKVAYPHTRHGTFASGTFVVQPHPGDWHTSAKLYRAWFERHFPVPTWDSWLRQRQAWFSAIIYHPEDKVVADLDTFAGWAEEAIEAGIDGIELLGWDSGGIERNYPEYVPEAKLGGWPAYKRVIERVDAAGGSLITFANYQVLDTATQRYADEWHRYRRMDSYGTTENHMSWGYGTFKAATGTDTRRHVPASVAVPGFQELVNGYLLDLVRAGSPAIQLDKLCIAGQLDFNPGHDHDPDLPMCEDLVQAVANFLRQATAINPNFRLASEGASDRFLSYIDVYYRAVTPNDISPLRYVFPEWTACVHLDSPYDFVSVNAAIMLGAVLDVEPFMYNRPVSDPGFRLMLNYIREVLALRKKLWECIFLAEYCDKEGASIETESSALDYRVHRRIRDGAPAVVVINRSRHEQHYRCRIDDVSGVTLWSPFAEQKPLLGDDGRAIKGEGLHVLVGDRHSE